MDGAVVNLCASFLTAKAVKYGCLLNTTHNGGLNREYIAGLYPGDRLGIPPPLDITNDGRNYLLDVSVSTPDIQKIFITVF